MNVNREKKYLWLAPEQTNSELFYYLFMGSGFECLHGQEHSKNKLGFSQDEWDDTEFQDYEIITSLKNPYDRLVQIYLEYEIKPIIPITKDLEPKLVHFFQKWVLDVFETNKLVVRVNDWGKDVLISKVIKKFLFRDKVPSIVIRSESIIDDLSRIIGILPGFDLQKKRELENTLINESPSFNFDFKNFYNFDIAKIVYNYYFNHFYIGNYDPFSFSFVEINEREKNKFLHDTF
jgi:hypothetical protein